MVTGTNNVRGKKNILEKLIWVLYLIILILILCVICIHLGDPWDDLFWKPVERLTFISYDLLPVKFKKIRKLKCMDRFKVMEKICDSYSSRTKRNECHYSLETSKIKQQIFCGIKHRQSLWYTTKTIAGKHTESSLLPNRDDLINYSGLFFCKAKKTWILMDVKFSKLKNDFIHADYEKLYKSMKEIKFKQPKDWSYDTWFKAIKWGMIAKEIYFFNPYRFALSFLGFIPGLGWFSNLVGWYMGGAWIIRSLLGI